MIKNYLFSIIDEYASKLTDISDRIWELAELSMSEHTSAACYVQFLRDEGFEVEDNLAGIPTGFSGKFGNGKPVIGILGEYDALSGLSQQSGITEKSPIVDGGNGHGCGHNLLGAASLGAAIALKRAIQDGMLSGTVVFYGCPGEEGCAGKTFMARAGLFRDLDAALCWHPSDVNEVTTGSCAASLQYEYTFQGISAHAAGDPENGRSALDAAELMNIGVQFLREHMPKTASVHYAFTDCGGISPNVVQPISKLVYMIRDSSVKKAKVLLQRVNEIAQGAAMMTGTQVTYRQIDGTSSTLSNTIMEKVLYDNLKRTPLPVYTAEELTYASQLKSTFTASQLPGQATEHSYALQKEIDDATSGGTLPLNNFVIPYIGTSAYNSGSTDVGDVSWLTPTAQFTAVTWVSGSPGHSWQNVSIGKTSIAHKGLLFAAKVLAGAASDIMLHPSLLVDIQKEFKANSAEGYDCPLEDSVTLP